MKKTLLGLLLTCGLAAAQPRDLDLFLLIGQSNMAGRGVVEDMDKETNPRVFMFNKEMQWAPAADPLHWDKPPVAGVGLGRSFAFELLKAKPDARIGLIPAAFGGSSLTEWDPSAGHYKNAVERTRAAMKDGRLRGILWHQGEADSGTAELASSYRARFTAWAARLRADLDAAEVPIIVGGLGEFFGKDKFAGTVNEQLAITPLTVPKSGFVPSSGLNAKSDNVHFDSPSLREFGRRYAHAFLMLAPGFR